MDQSPGEVERLRDQIEAKKKSNGEVFGGFLIGGLVVCLLAWAAGGSPFIAAIGFALMIAGVLGLAITTS